MKKISLIIMALLGNFYYSQHINPVAPINISGASLTHDQLKSYIDNVNNNTLIYRENDDYSLFKGSPYLDSTYKKVKIDDFLMPQKLRYNAYSDKMEFEKDGKIYDAQIPDNAVLNFFEFNKNFKKMKYTLDGKDYDGFLTIVSEGKFLALYKKESIKLREGDGLNNGIVDHRGAVFSNQKPVYICLFDNKYSVLPKNKKEIINKFSIVQGLAKFIDDNKIDVKDDLDLAKLANYINDNLK